MGFFITIPNTQMTKKEEIKVITGTVLEALPNTMFKIKPDETEEEMLAHLSGKMRRYRIKVVVGDKVQVEISPYGDRGRISRRF